jgi:hypothetical protein
MATVQEEVLRAFHEKLAASGSIDPPTIEALRKLLTLAKKWKADDFVTILAQHPTGGDR